MEELVILCKYCKRNTTHRIESKTEYKSRNGLIIRCFVCGFTKFLYKDGTVVKVDDSRVPERKIILPYDKEWSMGKINSEEEEQANKRIDEWLKHPIGYFKGRKLK